MFHSVFADVIIGIELIHLYSAQMSCFRFQNTNVVFAAFYIFHSTHIRRSSGCLRSFRDFPEEFNQSQRLIFFSFISIGSVYCKIKVFAHFIFLFASSHNLFLVKLCFNLTLRYFEVFFHHLDHKISIKKLK